VVLRWHLQRGDVIFPKSMSQSRIRENFRLFDFELDQDDVDALASLDRGESGRVGPNPDVFDRIS
jgi:2,5-diketo-D-gluconate reductase A